MFSYSRCPSNDRQNAEGDQTDDCDQAERKRLHLHDEDSRLHQGPLVHYRKGDGDDHCGRPEVKGKTRLKLLMHSRNTEVRRRESSGSEQGSVLFFVHFNVKSML